MSPPAALQKFIVGDNQSNEIKRKVPKLAPGIREGVHSWLAEKLHKDRDQLLQIIEWNHRCLLEQFGEQSNLDDDSSPKRFPPDVATAGVMLDVGEERLPLRQQFLSTETDIDKGLQPIYEPSRRVLENDVQDPASPNGDGDLLEEDAQPGADDEIGSEERGQESAVPLAGKESGSMANSLLVECGHMDSSDDLTIHRHTSFESTQQGRIFELFFAAMIMINTLVMAMHAQYNGLQLGYDLSYRTYTSSAEEAWPGAETTFEVLEKFFTILFTIEYCIRFVVERCKWFTHGWCYIDGIIVIFAWMLWFKDDLIPINLTFVRLARFSKLMRVIRLMQSQEVFDSLKLLVAAIKASTHTLFWSLCILLLIQCIAGLFMVQMLEAFLEETENQTEEEMLIKRRVFGYWGTFWRAMITMFEITFANWVTSCRFLIDNVSEGYGAFYLVYRCVCGFAVLMVVQAVFIQQTMKTTQLDDHHLAKQKQKSKQKLSRRLELMFKQLDKSGDGYLQWDEFDAALKMGDMEAMLGVFELEASDFESLFRLLDDGDGCISIDEFITGVEHMKGPAREVDMLEMKQMLKNLDCKIMETRRIAEITASATNASYSPTGMSASAGLRYRREQPSVNSTKV